MEILYLGAEYDAAARWCAVRGFSGAPGDSLPEGLSVSCSHAIDNDPDAFMERVADTAYGLAMDGKL